MTEGDDNIIIPIDYHLSNNALEMGKGNDTATDLSGRGHTINGGEGNDIISVTAGNNWLKGGDGNDELYSGQGNDRLSGGDGDDLLCSLGGDNILEGGEGNDTYIIELGNGITKIVDLHGTNKVIFKDSKLEQWSSSRQGNTLIFVRKDSQQKVNVYNYYSRDEKQSEQMFSFHSGISPIIAGDLHLLRDSMAIMPEKSADNSQLAMSIVPNIPAVQQPPTFLQSQSPFIAA
ncbi:RTX toxin and Ca2+-binding protein [Yersinia aldovae ATCC 35236]|uniref:calcium-binding protein n=1 Tax=Yersinia aldovae TaxID=29483 RepID=UPI0001A56342|nr:calcium-binding protein [Yersinia aldovae]EEP95298.1 RTX toxin and Ca2+-binding protein [Yersinia aldovae ATCC 35236]